jgi:hypothetical protein
MKRYTVAFSQWPCRSGIFRPGPAFSLLVAKGGLLG